MNLKKVNVLTEDINPFKKIGAEWFLLTAGNKEKFNMMTASWGSMGVMWNKNVVTCVIRPQRYTLEFIKNNDKFSISFLNQESKDALKLCGSKSGRDFNKMTDSGLTPVEIDNTITFKEATMTLVCRKLYCQQINRECFIDTSLISNYQNDDYHYAFVGEIVDAYKNN